MEFGRTYSLDSGSEVRRNLNTANLSQELEADSSSRAMPGWRHVEWTSRGISEPWYRRLELYRKLSR